MSEHGWQRFVEFCVDQSELNHREPDYKKLYRQAMTVIERICDRAFSVRCHCPELDRVTLFISDGVAFTWKKH